MRRRLRRSNTEDKKSKSSSPKKNHGVEKAKKTKALTTAAGLLTSAQLFKRQKEIAELRASGYTIDEIAQRMSLPRPVVSTLLLRGCRDYLKTRDDAVENYLSVAQMRCDNLLKVWMPRALGYTEREEQEDGTIVEKTYEPDPEAFRIVRSMMSDMHKVFGANKVRIEHTGNVGGNVNYLTQINFANLTEEQLEKIQAGDASFIRQLGQGQRGAYSLAAPGQSSIGVEEEEVG